MIDGHNPAQAKVSAITKMPELSCKQEVQSFIGMINYWSKFSARLSQLSTLIRELSKERVLFNWGPEHYGAFNAIKKEIVKAPILVHYNPNKEMVLQTDASTKKLGTCLMQQGKPMYFAIKALTETQKGYVATKLESFGSNIGHGKIPSFPIWHPLHFRDGSKTLRSNPVQGFEPGNTMIARNSHPDIPVSFYQCITFWDQQMN